MMKAGKYYVGDLCYVLNDVWDEFCSITIEDHDCLDGEFQLSDGTKFASYRTKWGDGQYADQHRRWYAVDAGLIGCVSLEDLEKYGVQPTEEYGMGGNVIEFKEEFETSGGKHDGIITFGHIVIDTAGNEWGDDLDDGWGEEE